jgi:PAS domain S-box-containing protein
METSEGRALVVIHDDSALLRLATTILIQGGFDVQPFQSVEALFQQKTPDLQELEKILLRVVSHIDDVMYSVDSTTGEYRYISPAFEKVLGYTMEDIRQMGGRKPFLAQVIQGGNVSQQNLYVARSQSEPTPEGPEYHEAWWRCKDGSRRCLEDRWIPVYEGSRMVGMDGVLRDITRQKRTEEALRGIAQGALTATGMSFLSSLVQHLAEVLDVDYAFIGKLAENNPEVIRTVAVSAHGKIVHNFEYRLAETPSERVVGKSLCHYPRGVQGLFPNDHLLTEMQIESYIGIPLFNSVGQALGVMTALHSKTLSDPRLAELLLQIFSVRAAAELERSRAEEEKVKLEVQLRQSQKMEAIGRLAGGVAHDFNNLLTGILGYANLLKEKSDPGDNIFQAAEMIERAAGRAAQLTGQLLGFARKGKHQNVPVDLTGTIHEVIGLLKHTIDKNIVIRQRLRAHPASVLGDPGQMQQVILNLAVNARDAMPLGGELCFETDLVELDSSYCRTYAGATPGQYYMVSITDTGCGIPLEIQDRIFEPFFTTKEPGKGTGMGLAMVYGIVKNHGGSIRVHSEVRQGTTFKVYLPVPAESPDSQVISQEIALAPGIGRILVVDDEEMVRTVTKEMLSSLGYQVVTVSDGQEAVEYYRGFGTEIDLVIIDMIMPKLGGRDCFRALKAINPSVKAILATGYDRNGAAQEILNAGMLGFVQKPYQMSQLSEVIANVLRK